MIDEDAAGPPFQPDRIIETLLEHRVRFVLVGGSAAQLHGAQRLTRDADVVVEYSRANLQRLSAALDELNWRLRAEGLPDAEAIEMRGSMPMHPDLFDRSTIHTLMTDAGAIDILRAIPTIDGETPGRNYEMLAEDAIVHSIVPGLAVKLASLDHIIESKKWANRPKDVDALAELEDIRRRRQSQGTAELPEE